MITEQQKWDYLQDETRYQLERMRQDEQEDIENYEEWSAAQQNYRVSLGVSQ